MYLFRNSILPFRGRIAASQYILCLDKGQGVAAPDPPAAAGWYERAATLVKSTRRTSLGILLGWPR